MDTETSIDETQRLLFGSYRVYDRERLIEEGLIAADDLHAEGHAVLAQYVNDHPDDRGGHLRLRTRAEFVEQVLWRVTYVARGRIVGFNLPFDLSRLAIGARPARNGGFTLILWDWADAKGRRRRHLYRPEITVKPDGSKRQFIHYTTPPRLDAENKVAGRGFRGRFLDLHTFAYALTDRGLTLDGAAADFGALERKTPTEHTGTITAAYIDYNRQDVRTTYSLYRALLAEWARHPIALDPEQAFSPAAVSKAYLRAIGVPPPLDRRGELTTDHLGYYMTAYYGGRAEVRIRRVRLPVRYVDFSSMYPTVFALQGLWSWVIADHFDIVDATGEIRDFLAGLTREALLDPSVWRTLAGVVCRIRPNGNLLPVRARYGQDPDTGIGAPAWTIGLNALTAEVDLWYMLADLAAGVLLGGPVPEVLESVRVVPVGVAPGLESVALRDAIRVPPTDDLFRRATEERRRVQQDASLPEAERRRLGQFLKTLANGGSYGIFAEYHQRQPVAAPGALVSAHGLWPIKARVRNPEEPGEFCFPPLAASVTAAARLMLALLESGVEAAGGNSVACDTDSLLIVASHLGGLVACPGARHRLPDGRAAVRALSYAEVDAVIGELDRLDPYDRTLVPSLVKLEPENVGPDDPADVELYAVAISAKRYALYQVRDGERQPMKPSSHGLGLYRPPYPEPIGWNRGWRAWIDEVWAGVIDGLEGSEPTEVPAWHHYPAVSQLGITSPLLLAPFRGVNAGKAYADQVKPFNFLLVGHIDPLAALPDGLERDRLVPVAPYTTDGNLLLGLRWRNRRDGQLLSVTTAPGGKPGTVRLRTYGDVIADHRWHPEHKSGDPGEGRGCRTSVGVLPRLHVIADRLPVHIGKESNRLDEVEDAATVEANDGYTVYRDERAEWAATLPGLRRLRDEKGWRYLAGASGLSERELRYALNGGKVPHMEARARLIALVAP